ncbi:MAG TPA: P-type conjugative transfer protein TrbL [Candidatus Binataceae bacterium]|nr:P-type conjugative transfer protein TrbL [Candidatus Binataceae bacterium]
MGTFDEIANQFNTAALKYSAAIQPFAIKLFFGLLLLDILVTWIQFLGEGQLDSSFFLGRLIKHVLSGGFIYLMITNALPWMEAVLSSFSRIGALATGLPALSPQTVLQLGGNMASTIFSTPATASLMTDVELAIVQSVSAFVVLLSFVVTAAMLLLTLIEAYLVVGCGVILLGFGANRFTAPAAEGYFGYVIRVGVRLLFFYLVLAIGVQIANQWSAAITAACKPVPATLPWWTTYGAAPGSIITTVCSGMIPVSVMLDYAAFAIVFMIVCIAVPNTAAGIAGGTIGLALNHAFEAAFIAQSVIRPITSALQTGFNKVAQIGSSSGDKSAEGTGWVSAMTFGRETQKLGNPGPDAAQRVPAPKDVRTTSVIPSRAPNTTPMNPGTARYGSGNTTTTNGRPTSKI